MIKSMKLLNARVLVGMVARCLLILTAGSAFGQSKLNSSGEMLPHLQPRGTAVQLIVDGQPFLALAGELGNSSASNPDSMQSIWSKLEAMKLNTVLVPVYWELIEPEEGRFDFSTVDAAIGQAGQHRLKIVFLWFGTWKNSMSCYAPGWVKENLERFPRARTKEGRSVEILSAFSEEVLRADAKAFVSFMKHLRQTDEDRAVIMVQVENEIGMIPDAREYGPAADEAFRQPVPDLLMNHLLDHRDSLVPDLRQIWERAGSKPSGTWEEVFGPGPDTDEIFMAWHFARYVERITAAGKVEYPLPMFVNAALNRPGRKPGEYPSAGPLPHLFDVWKAGAPAISFLSPDIYFPNFSEWCEKYRRIDNPLFIPEATQGPESAVNALYAFGQGAIGFSPFSIESADDPENEPLAASYGVIAQLTPFILENQGKGTMAGVLLDSIPQVREIPLGDYVLTFRHEMSWAWGAKSREGESVKAGGLVIQTGPEEYLIAGKGMLVTFKPSAPDGSIAGIESADEVRFENGKAITGRRLNGDQTHQGRHVHLSFDRFGIQRVRLYRYR